MMNSQLTLIKTNDQYESYLSEVEFLISTERALNQTESTRLELLSLVIKAYEDNKYPVEPPNPIDAILFRMNEKGMKRADLVPYLGTSGRVSEVLNGKRPLTVQMIRALSLGLGLSADTLVGLCANRAKVANEVEWRKFPAKEMVERGWIEKISKDAKSCAEQTVKGFIENAGLRFSAASFKRSLAGEADSPTTRYALYAWLARVVYSARARKSHLGKFDRNVLSATFLRDIARLSWSEKGPLLAVEYLEKHGIAVVIERQLRGTLLDGAAIQDYDEVPIIGLTLRHDRLDNFWFTLLHEVAHVWRHVEPNLAFVDNLDASSEDRREAEANRLAQEAFIPRLIWRRSEAFTNPSKESIDKLSRELKIHPAIIAGRLRRDTGNYQQFGQLIGHDAVRKLLEPNNPEEARK